MTIAAAEQLDFKAEMDRGFAQAGQSEIERVRRDMRIEQAWLSGQPRYSTNEDVMEAYSIGDLVLVGPNEYYRPVATLLDEKNFNQFQPFLTPGAAEALRILGQRAGEKIQTLNLGYEVRLPVTSMVRSMERQAEIWRQPGKLALSPEESGHSTGWDFDIDSSSYYMLEDGQWKSVSLRNPNTQRRLNYAREQHLGATSISTQIARPGVYNSQVRVALHHAIAELYAEEMLCPVVEYTNEIFEVLHIGVNPAYFG